MILVFIELSSSRLILPRLPTEVYIITDGQPPRHSHGRRVAGSVASPGPGPGLAEDYAEIVDEEGDYSSPARVTTISTDIDSIY